MQEIKHKPDFEYISPIFNELDRFYADVSDTKPKHKQQGLFSLDYDKIFLPLLQLIEAQSGYSFCPMVFRFKEYAKVKVPKMNPKNIIVCYSGGKDSFSVIRHYQELGYNVYAYHIKGLNKTYYDEWEVAKQMAKELGVPLYIDNVSYIGTHIWIEHPLKNMLMASMALTWGIKNGISAKIACGTFKTAYVEDVAFEVCAGDCIDMWKLFEDIVKRVIPNFHMYIPNKNYQTSYIRLTKEPQYLPLTISCITPNRFRDLFRRRTMTNYNVTLMPHRCGCCWKCAAEYIWFCDHDILDFNKDYYIHCIEVLLHNLEQETGYFVYDLKYLWKTYLFYSMKKSKAYKELKNAFVRSGKIKITD